MLTIPNVPERHPDELFYSWMGRCALENGFDFIRPFINAYITPNATDSEKSRRVLNYSYLDDYQDAQRAAVTKNSPENFELFQNTSLYPFFAPFMSSYQQASVLHKVFRSNANDFNWDIKDVNMIPKLHVCPVCMKEEIGKFGHFYYHRAHQLPGVSVCHEHKTSLCKYSGTAMHEMEKDCRFDAVQCTNKEDDYDYAVFAKGLLDSALPLNEKHLKAILQTKASKTINDENEFIQAVSRHPYSKHCRKSLRSIWKVINSSMYPNISDLIWVSLILFGDFESFKEACTKKIEECCKEPGWLAQRLEETNCHLTAPYSPVGICLEHSCGQEIILHPTEYRENWACPKCGIRSFEMPNPKLVKEWTEDLFRAEVSRRTNGEYRLVSSFINLVEKVELQHVKCGNTFRMKPTHFLDGFRCPNCKEFKYEREFRRIVSDISAGEYEVHEKRTTTLFAIYNNKKHFGREMTQQKILQELKENSKSSYLPLSAKSNTEAPQTNSKFLLDWIHNHCPASEPVFLEDLVGCGYSYQKVKRTMQTITKSALMVGIAPGIYAFPDQSFTTTKILKSRYLLRNGKRIGYPFGRTALYEIGVIKIEPDDFRAVSMKEASSNSSGRTTQFMNKKLRIRGTMIEITEENWKILMILDLICNLQKYQGDLGEKAVYERIAEYVIKSGLSYADFSAYQAKYVFSYKPVRKLFHIVDSLRGGYRP